MDKEKGLFQIVDKSVKNAISKAQQSNTEIVKETRGRKKGIPIRGIISHKGELIKALIESYIEDANIQNINTCQASLARYINEKRLIGNIKNGVFKPLSISSILVYISSIWEEVEKNRQHKPAIHKNTHNEL
ncbi:hypothetical protein OXV64_22230 [Bacteroides fragilis]|uniref:hypothetical protein n=4 Tax=Bacteroides hominis TaxID=2763023 RepID=UPI002294316A|nr:hypothetical protein [Bacteroides fragilis]